MDLWRASPNDLLQEMLSANLRRGYLVTDPGSGELVASHPVFESIRAAVASDSRDYRAHEGMFFAIGAESGHLLTAFVHKTKRGQAAGGVRYWHYNSNEELVRDGLRLAMGMGHKCALAGLWWGGGKGVIARTDPGGASGELRQAVFRDYGSFISDLRGCYVTAEDAGTAPEDLADIFSRTRHTSCIPSRFGGSGNPSVLTAMGVVVAMEAACEFLELGSLEGKTVAIQGLGNVSRYTIEGLLERRVSRIIGVDIFPEQVEHTVSLFPEAPLDVSVVERGDQSILGAEADIVVPNATGATLNQATIPTIKARIVCGGANNQLEDPVSDAQALDARGILYVPDFLANRMGIVNCANEQYGVIPDDPAVYEHLDRGTPHGIHKRSMEVFRTARSSKRTTAAVAVELADRLTEELHPVWGHRGQVIIDSLVQNRWDRP